MLSINTNLSSLIAQSSMKSSTNKLNQAIERMTTGFKINHAKDNAANYSISTNMTTKIGAYNVAEDNAAMGLDLISTAEGTLDQIQDKLQRLRALAEQASNGTYGEQSKQAINAEANALVDEIERIYNNSEYNGINLMKGRVTGTEESKFIKDIDRRDTSKMTTLASVDESKALTSGTYSISTAEELAKLATMTNNGLIGAATEFVLANDVDLSGYSNWTPIGVCNDAVNPDYSKFFQGVFDGNGFIVSNLTINDNTKEYLGLFGAAYKATFKNVGVEDVDIYGRARVASLAAIADYTNIYNCYANGDMQIDYSYIGGLLGIVKYCDIDSCSADVDIKSLVSTEGYTGGLIAEMNYSNLSNSFAIGCVESNGDVGGLATFAWHSQVINCYSDNTVKGGRATGGLLAAVEDALIKNCYSKSIVSGGWTSQLISSSGYNAEHQPHAYTTKIINCQALNFSNNIQGVFLAKEAYWQTPYQDIIFENCSYLADYDTSGIPLLATATSANTLAEAITPASVEDATAPFTIDTNANVNILEGNLVLQVGINSNSNSQISLNTDYLLDSLSILRRIGTGAGDYLTMIDKMLAQASEKQTMFGATSNRLESVLEEITIQRDNLVSSRSTIRDADIAEVSSHYIQQQILQQAAATLLATANQSPSIALQLI